jgi:hypothetical protein
VVGGKYAKGSPERSVADPFDAQIAAVASPQHRTVTRRQLLRIGLSSRAIEHRVSLGRLHREHAGVYSVGGPARTPHERAHATVLAGGELALLAGRSAMALWEFIRYWPDPFEIVTPENRRPRGITVHHSRTLTERDRTMHHDIPVTSPGRTMLDCAQALGDRLEKTLHRAFHTPFLTMGLLWEVCELHPGHPGTRLILPLLRGGERPTRSEWERSFPADCVAAGLPCPEINVVVHGRERDAYFREERLIVELDSFKSHGDKYPFEDDRERDVDALDHDVETVRITWDRHHNASEKEFARLGRILARRRAYCRGDRQPG